MGLFRSRKKHWWLVKQSQSHFTQALFKGICSVCYICCSLILFHNRLMKIQVSFPKQLKLELSISTHQRTFKRRSSISRLRRCCSFPVPCLPKTAKKIHQAGVWWRLERHPRRIYIWCFLKSLIINHSAIAKICYHTDCWHVCMILVSPWVTIISENESNPNIASDSTFSSLFPDSCDSNSSLTYNVTY